LPPGKGDGQLIPQMDQVQPFQNLFGPSLQVAFLSLHPPPTEPGGEQVFPYLVGGNHHQVLQDGHAAKLPRDLKGAHQPSTEQMVRGQAGDVFPI